MVSGYGAVQFGLSLYLTVGLIAATPHPIHAIGSDTSSSRLIGCGYVCSFGNLPQIRTSKVLSQMRPLR
jgi:hypothetical protein